MKTNHEKTTRMMGFVVSILLHGIFLAGCVAISYNPEPPSTEATEINQTPEMSEVDKS